MKEEVLTHESFGQISFSRVNGRVENFYGSEIPQNDYIELTISNSQLKRDLTQDWYYPKNDLIRVKMTSAQFAELITSLNFSNGVPCTIDYFNSERIPSFKVENRKDLVQRQFKEKIKEFSNVVRNNKNEILNIIQKKTLSKSDVNSISNLIIQLAQEIESNIPFYLECFQESLDKMETESKIETENAVLHKITSLGMKILKEQLQSSNEPNILKIES